jgi:hypothetical protein
VLKKGAKKEDVDMHDEEEKKGAPVKKWDSK